MAADACATDLVGVGSSTFGPRYGFVSSLSYDVALTGGSPDDILLINITGYRDELSAIDPDLSIGIASSGWTVMSDQTGTAPFGTPPRHFVGRHFTAWRRRGAATAVTVEFGAGYADSRAGTSGIVMVIENAPLLPTPALPIGVLTAPPFPSGAFPMSAKTAGEDCLAVILAGGMTSGSVGTGWSTSALVADGLIAAQQAWKWFGPSDVVTNPTAFTTPGNIGNVGNWFATTFLLASHSCSWTMSRGWVRGHAWG